MISLKKYFPFVVLISAGLVSAVGSFYSIYGIGRIFSGHQVGATFMAFALELGNIVTAAALKLYWNELPKLLRNYLCSAVVLLSIITSIGIYGFLSDAYQLTNNKDKIVQSKIQLLERKKERFNASILEYKTEKENLDNGISLLRKALSTDNQYQTVNNKGVVLTQIQRTSKKDVENELKISNDKSEILSRKIEVATDSVNEIETVIIEINSTNEVSSELGALKYLSQLNGVSMDVIVNWFLILIMIVFQPLAVALILVSLFAFSIKPNLPVKEEVILKKEEVPLEIIEPPKIKKTRKSRKSLETEEIKKFDITVEGVDKDQILFPADEEIKVPDKVSKVVERGLSEDLATHLSNSLKKKVN